MPLKTAILGLNSAGFNTSATLVIDGHPVFAIEEERLIREKRTRRFPIEGVKAALEAGGLDLQQIDAVAVGWNPAVNLEAPSQSQSQRARYLGEIFYSVPNNLMTLTGGNAAYFSQQVVHLQDGSRLNIYYILHHLAHAASFFVSGFDEAAILTADAFGEKDCTQFTKGTGNELVPMWSQEFPHSLGSFYSAFTSYLGFQHQSDEWKLMGASAHGSPDRFYDKVRSLVHLKDDGGFELDLSCFNHFQFHRPGLFTQKMTDVLGTTANEPEEPPNQEHFDLAASVQSVFEEIYLYLLGKLHERTGLKKLVVAGGSALNSVANGKILAETPFEELFVPPVPDDSGCSLGAAYYVYHQIMGKPRTYVMTQNYLGPSYSDAEIQRELDKYNITYEVVEDPTKIAASLIMSGRIIGWFQGRLEFGDRALGNRSILADPRDPSMKDKVNATVKFREDFRPFAPAILFNHLDEFFADAVETPFMEKVFPVRPEKRKVIPAVTHVDGSGRLQTVRREQNPLFHELISEFYRMTGVPVVLNTSFNVKGEAIVCSPQDALKTFFSSGLNALVIGNFLVKK